MSTLAHLAISTPLDHAEQARHTEPFWCLGCGGPVLREHLRNGDSITWHRTPLNPLCLVANSDQDNPQ